MQSSARLRITLLFINAGSASAWPTLFFGQQPSEPPTLLRKNFKQAIGHAQPIPADWLRTPEGNFARRIKLPDSIPTENSVNG